MEEDIYQRYKILEHIRQDKIFDKFIAYDNVKKELVILKICNTPYGRATRLGENLFRTFKIYSGIIHPNLFKIFDFGWWENKFYVILEYIKGDYLDRVIHRGILDVNTSLKIITSVVHGLKALEENYLFHGNLTINSIYIGENGEVKIDDIATNLLTFPIVETLSINDDIYNVGNIIQDLITNIYITKKDKVIYDKKLENILYKIKHKDINHRYSSVALLIDDLIMCTEEHASNIYIPEKKSSQKRYSEYNQTVISKYPKKQRKKVPISSFIIIIFLSLFAVYYYFFSLQHQVEIPDITNLTIEEAEKLLRKKGLKLRIERTEYKINTPAGMVLSQRPLPRSKTVKGGKTIHVIASGEPREIILPDVRRKQEQEAKIILENANLKIGKIFTVASDEIEKGYIVSQEPKEGTTVLFGESINLQVSSGPSQIMVEVPNLVGLSIDEATIKIEQMKLKLGYVRKIPQEDIPSGQIIAQSPRSGSKTKEGTLINLDISIQEKEIQSLLKKEPRYAEINVTIPEGINQKNVKVVVIDDTGSKNIYNKTHSYGDKIKLNIKGIGKTTIQVYIEDNLIKEETL